MEFEFHNCESKFCNELEALFVACSCHNKTPQSAKPNRMDPKWVRVLYKLLAGGEIFFSSLFSSVCNRSSSRVAQVDLDSG